MRYLSILWTTILVLSLTAFSVIAEDNLAAGTPVWVPVSHVDWGHGVIQAKTATGYTVKLDEGESQDFDQGEVAIDSVPDAKDLSASSRIIAKKSYGYFAAKITEINEDTFSVLYDDASIDQMSIDGIRLLLPPRPVSVAAAPAATPSSSTAEAGLPATTAAPEAGATTASSGTGAAGQQDTPGSIPAKHSLGTSMDDLNKEMREAAATTYTWDISLDGSKAGTALKFNDGSILVEFAPEKSNALNGPALLGLKLTNLTKSSISINWEKSYLTSLAGKQRTLYHDPNTIVAGSQANSIVAPGMTLNDAVTPKEGVVIHYVAGHYDDKGNWIPPWNQIQGFQMFFGDDLKGSQYSRSSDYEPVRAYAAGKSFQLALALTISGTVKPYVFSFKVNDISKVVDESRLHWNPIPTEVSAMAGNGQIKLTWKNTATAPTYNIYWSATSGVTPSNGTKIPGVISGYTLEGLSSGQTYYFIVTTVKPGSGGEEESSAFTKEVSATVLK